MAKNLQEALDNVQMTYSDLINISEDLVKPYTKDIDDIVSKTVNKIEILTLDELREIMLMLSLKAYLMSEIKDKASLKSACAETLRDEMYARRYNESQGTVKDRENIAILQSSYEILSQAIFDSSYSMLKTKVDSTHRVIDTLKTVLMSRMQEMKMTQINRDNDFGE